MFHINTGHTVHSISALTVARKARSAFPGSLHSNTALSYMHGFVDIGTLFIFQRVTAGSRLGMANRDVYFIQWPHQTFKDIYICAAVGNHQNSRQLQKQAVVLIADLKKYVCECVCVCARVRCVCVCVECSALGNSLNFS